jgi:hypothetical protein
MSSDVKRGQDALWLPRTLSAALLGVSASQFDSVVIPQLSSEHIRKAKAHLYFAPAVVKVYFARQALVKGTKPPGDDDLWSDYDSPNLERFRAAKADQAELDVMERQGKIIFVDQVRDRLSWLFAQLKQYGERLQHQFGRDAALMHNEFMEDMKAFDVESIASRKGS